MMKDPKILFISADNALWQKYLGSDTPDPGENVITLRD